MKRRDFLKSAGCFVASASFTGLLGCSSDSSAADKAGAYLFAQGVASGDPRELSVMLWTRVERSGKKPSQAPIELVLEVASSDDFKTLLVSKDVTASAASDFTVRVLVEKLTADTTYYYRFRAGADESRVGRTRTAPSPTADVPARFAWACCQDYSVNFYGPYRQLLNDDLAAKPEDQLQFVMHIGDFVYEARSASYELAVDDQLASRMLVQKDGSMRRVPEFPSGGAKTATGANYASSVDDYRHLYKWYLGDADLQDARARWPFISVWDDHEFTDDCWQTQANYINDASTDEPSQKRRVAASQAWFEYVPTALDDAEPADGVAPEAQDFKFVKVEDAPYTETVDVTEPNNVKAISAITIFRNLRWGKHVDLVITDNRSYRSDHALAEEVTKGDLLVFHPRAALAKDAVNIADAGRTANGGKPPDMALSYQNTRKNSPPGTMLGAAQKAWWKDVMKASDATWRIWGNSVPLLRILLDTSDVKLIPHDLILSADAWDGYNTERKELMKFLADNQIVNVVSLSGDHHANYAGVIYDDFDAKKPQPVMVDLCCAGISSNSQFHEVGRALDSGVPAALASAVVPVKRLITYDATMFGGDKAVVNFNCLIRYGSHAANVAADTNDLDKIEAARDPAINAHLRYADARATGYGLCSVTKDGVTATLVTIERSFEDLGDTSPGIRGTATFTVPKIEKLADVDLPEPMLTGMKPFPLR